MSINAFCNGVQQSIAHEIFDSNLFTDPNKNYEILEKILTENKQKHLPTRFVKFNKYKHKMSPWITSEIIRSIKLKDNLYKKLKIANQNSQSYESLLINLHTCQTILNKDIRMTKSLYYTEQLDKFRNDIRKTWSTLNGIIHKKSGKRDFPNYFTVNHTKISDKQSIANYFNSYFANIGPKLSDSIIYDGNKNVSSYLKDRVLHSFSFENVTEEDVLKTVKDLAPKTSAGHDEISTKLLKLITPHISGLLTLIMNQSLNTGIFPNKLKIAKVIPLFKKSDPHLFDNYRPISLLPSISKIYEKIVSKQLYDYFLHKKLLYNSQYGFRKYHSTEMAALELTDRVLHDLDNDKIPISVFLDLSKAFDTLDHSILLHKLEHYGIRGTSLEWFHSYLSNRSQFVDYDGTLSTSSPISTGVPQGSILGPLLFIIYINDIHEASAKFFAIIYADDTNLLNSLCSFDMSADRKLYNKNVLFNNINFELGLIQEWLAINKLSLNVQKTTFMMFHHKQRNIDNFIPILKIKDHTIERVESFNFLGLTVDQHMSWQPHIQKISNKISRTLGVMNRLKRFLPTRILKLIYNSLILPHLQFSILNWGFKHERLMKLQKRAVRIVTCSKYNSHTDPIFKKLNLLKIKDIFIHSLLKFYFKFEQKTLPHFFTSMLSIVTHSHDTRHRGGFYQCKPNTTNGTKCLRFFLPSLLNEAPPCIKDKVFTHSYKGFSNYVKNHLITQYPSECFVQNCYVCNQT